MITVWITMVHVYDQRSCFYSGVRIPDQSLMSFLKGIFQISDVSFETRLKRSNLSPVMRLFFHGGPICVSLMTRHFYQDFAHHEVRASDRRDAGDYATRQRNKKNAGKRGVKFVKCKGKTRQQ